jgi:hypothetical protein
MRGRDVALSIAAGVLILVVALPPTPIAAPMLRYVIEPALALWYVGVAATAAAILLRWARRWPAAARVVGVVGVTWITLVATLFVLVVLIFTIAGPIGY